MQIDVSLALRYLGAAGAGGDVRRQVERAAEELTARVQPRHWFRDFSLEKRPEGWLLPEAGLLLPGSLADRMLDGCFGVSLLVCTLGAAFDALLRAAQAQDMARAVVLDACGSAYVEAACDVAEEEIAARHPGVYLTDRFSPGYGDLPLSLQGDLLRALDAGRRAGVYVTENAFMVPAKSVSAIVGLAQSPRPARIRGCACCQLRENCSLRERGENCGAS